MAGNTRFHSKYHFAQHHSEVTEKTTQFPDAATDPIASQTLPFQGDFYSDGVLKIHSLDPNKFNYFGNDVEIDSDLIVTQNTSISGDLTVVGNVTLKANPELAEAQVIKIGDDKDGEGNTVDKVKFVAYVDSDLSPDDSLAHNLGEYHKRWWWLYVTNLSLDGEFKIGTCSKDSLEVEDRGLYINLKDHVGQPARVGINTCSPTNELSVVGRTDITETLTLTGNAFFHSNLILDGNADIDGDIILLDDNIIYWNNKDVAITANQEEMNLRHPIKFNIDTPVIETTTYSVDVFLREATDALDIHNCLMLFDTVNRRVGINTCEPVDNLDVRGSVNIEGHHVYVKTDENVEIQTTGDFQLSADADVKFESENLKTYTRNETVFTANKDVIVTSEESDIELQAPKGAVNILVKDFGVSVQDEYSIAAGQKIRLNSPFIEVVNQRLKINSDDWIEVNTTDRTDNIANDHVINIDNDQIINVTRDRITTIGRDDKLFVKRDRITEVDRDDIELIKHDSHLTVNNNRHTHILQNDSLVVGVDLSANIMRDKYLVVDNNKIDHVKQNNHVTIDNDQVVTIGVDQTSTIGNDQTQVIKHDQKTTVENNQHLDVLVDRIETIHRDDIKHVDRDARETVTNNKLTDVENIYTIDSGNYTNIINGNLGLDLTDPVYRMSIPCGDEIGTSRKTTTGEVSANSYIEFCSVDENTAGDHDMTLFNDNQSDIVFDPGRSVVVPNNNVGIGKVPEPEYALEVVGQSHLIGRVITDGTMVDTTLNDNQVIYKDDITKAHTTTMEFYYDGIRAAIGHIPAVDETAMLYVAKGPIRLESRSNNILTIDSSRTIDFSSISDDHIINSAVFESPVDHNMVVDLRNNNENTAFIVRSSGFVDGTDVYTGEADTIALMVRPESSREKAFFGFNTTRNVLETTDSSGIAHNYDAVFNAHMDVTGDLHVGDDIHIEDNAVIDGKIRINSEDEIAGLEVYSGRADLIEVINNVEHRFEIGSHTDLFTRSTSEIPGSGSVHGSTISNATNDHFVLDLRNTSEEHRFAIRYSSDNTGVADKIVMTAGHYIYDIPNPNFDSSQPVSSANPQTIKDPLQGHVGINCVATPGYHLDVNGTMRITGDFVVEGDETTIRVGNVTVEDKNIILNIVPDGVSSTAVTNDAGVLIQGDNNEIVGYWKVHDTDVDKLVAKAPTGKEVMLDVNGTVTSNLTLADTNITSNFSNLTLQDTNFSSLSGDHSFVNVNSIVEYADITVTTADQTARPEITLKTDLTTNPTTGRSAFPVKLSLIDSEQSGLRSSINMIDSDYSANQSTQTLDDSTHVQTNSTLTLNNSTESLNQSTMTMDASTAVVESTTININDSTVTVDTSSITSDNSTVLFDSGSSFTAESGRISIINQDLTTDSTEAQFSQLVLTDSLTVPVGNDKGLTQDGNIRYNSTTGEYEGYVQNNGANFNGATGHWVPFNRVSDEDGDTYIQPQTSLNTDEDRLDFYIDGVRIGYMSSNVITFDAPIINNHTTGLKVPVGNTAERPECLAQGSTDECTGIVRFNTDLVSFEGYNGANWTNIGGLIDVDRDTYITPESSPQSDEDELVFVTANSKAAELTTSLFNVYRKTTVSTSGSARVAVGGPIRSTFNNNSVNQLTPTSAQAATGMQTGRRYYVFNHNGGEQYPLVQVYDNNKRMIIPDEIHLTSNNQVCIDLTSFGTISGTWCIVVYV